MKIDIALAKKILRIVLIAAMIVTVAFIFSNSMKSKEESAADSSTVGNIIAEIIPPDTTLGAAIQKNLRKRAHFTEFGALGIEVALYIWLFCDKRLKTSLLSAFIGFGVGFLDETIQIFFDRGAAIGDVWIDGGGFIFFSAIAHCVLFLAALVIRRVAVRKKAKEVPINGEEEKKNG